MPLELNSSPTNENKSEVFCQAPEGHVFDCRGSEKRDIPEGETIMSLIARLGMRQDQIGVIFLNSKIVDAEAVLHDGDQVGLTQPQLGF